MVEIDPSAPEWAQNETSIRAYVLKLIDAHNAGRAWRLYSIKTSGRFIAFIGTSGEDNGASVSIAHNDQYVWRRIAENLLDPEWGDEDMEKIGSAFTLASFRASHG